MPRLLSPLFTHFLRRLLISGGVLLALTPFLVLAAQPSPERSAMLTSASVILYDGALNTGTPDTQAMLYLARPFGSAAARQTFADGVTTLTTTLQTADTAGYFASTPPVPTLDRATGFTLRFTVQLVAENHAGSDKNGDGIGDRAGLSVILLSSDHTGVELGFWHDQIWAQDDGAAQPPPNSNTLFTHAEGAPFDPTTGLIPYELTIQGDTYTLASGGQLILQGRVRDYSAFGFPYTSTNFVFLGDDTGSADATINLAAVSIAANSVAASTPTPSPSTPPTAPTLPTDTPTTTPTRQSMRALLPVVKQP